jgi:hypothetical protein
MRRLDCHDRVKGVKRSFETALKTINALIDLAKSNPKYINQYDLDLVAMRSLHLQLHDVYFARMFSVFESSLRHFWRAKIRNSKPGTEQLLASLAAKLGVPQDDLDAVQEIREFRNSLLHEEHAVKRRFGIDEACGCLNKFLARLPIRW